MLIFFIRGIRLRKFNNIAAIPRTEIIISGKLRTERSRNEKFRDGYVPKSGDPALKNVRKAVVHVQLKQGILGVKVLIMPPGIEFPDQVHLLEEENDEQMEKETLNESLSEETPKENGKVQESEATSGQEIEKKVAEN